MKISELTDHAFDQIDRPCLYTPGERHLTTMLTRHPKTKGIVCMYGGKTIHQLEREHPEAHVYGLEQATALIEESQNQHYVKPWIEIDQERYDEMLNVLPPERWSSHRGVSFFSMCEYTTGNLTGFFAHLNGRYFEATRPATIPGEDIADQVYEASQAS